VAATAFVGTNIDNCVVTATMVAGAPLHRSHRIAAGQVVGFVVVVAVAAAGAAVLYEFSPAAVGLLGLVPLAIGLRGLALLLRHRGPDAGDADDAGSRRKGRRPATERAVGRSFTAGVLVTIGAGGDNLAVYIPLFREGGTANLVTLAVVFALGEVVVTMVILAAGRHPRARGVMAKLGALAVPLLLCGIGVLVLVSAGTLSWLF
jgi:cadmium resistance protein CadD (predicted permease)